MKRIFCLLLAVFVFANVSFADEAPPPTPKKQMKNKSVDSFMQIRLDENANEPVLKISKNQLKDLRAQLDELDDASDNSAALGGISRTQTIVGGMFLSLAFVFGGVLFARSKKTDGKTSKIIAAGAVLFLCGTAATFVFANAGPPPRLRSISGQLFDKKVFGFWKRASGAIKIEVVENGDNVELIVPDKEEKINKNEE